MSAVLKGFQALMSRKYSLWGQDTDFVNPKTGEDMVLRLIDTTRGVEVGDGIVSVATVEPAALVRKTEITANDLRASDLINSVFTLNGVTWKVESTQPRPTVHGPEEGEVVLLLARACD